MGTPGNLAVYGTQDEEQQTMTQHNMCWTPQKQTQIT